MNDDSHGRSCNIAWQWEEKHTFIASERIAINALFSSEKNRESSF